METGWTTPNPGSKSFRNIFALGLMTALAAAVCVPGLAQSNSSKNSSLIAHGTAPTLKSRSLSRLAAAPSKVASFQAKSSATGLSSLPATAQGPISAALGKDNSGYWLHPSAKGFRGENHQQALMAEFTRRGAEVHSKNFNWALETLGYGYGDALHPVKPVAPQTKANRVEYRRDGLTEWYENGPLGLEQGFTLAERPANTNGLPLTLELGVRGDLVIAAESGGKALELRAKNGKAELRYTGLTARDATGRELPSWLEARGDRLRLRVADRGARYPVIVDPWIQQAELTASDGGGALGWSVAVSGSTAVVGAIAHTVGSNFAQGAAYVFEQSGTTWTQQAELTASDGGSGDEFGWSVAVSGGTAVVGAPGHTVGSNTDQGAAYVFVGSGGSWSQKAELTASDGAVGDQLGVSAALSGGTAVVGVVNHVVGGANQGVAYVFVESGSDWIQQAELTASDGAAGDDFGSAVAVGGSTAVVGSPSHTVGANADQGAAYVFVASGGSWNQQAELTASDGESVDLFGHSVAASGSTVVVGSPLHTVASNQNQGAAYVFIGSGGSWSQQAEITSSDGAKSDYFGYAVAISGSTAASGSPYHKVGSNGGQGATYVFVQSGSTWSQQAELTASNGAKSDTLGYSAAVSGSTVVAGAPAHTVGSASGAAYVFVSESSGQPTVTLTPASLSFGDQALETTSTAKSVTLKNTSTVTLDITNISITLGTEFKISSNTCASTLAAGKSCKVSVTFTPTEVDAYTGTLSFTDNAVGSPQTVPLSGTGVAQATLTPTSLTFAKTKVGTTSAAKKVTLKNNLPTPLTGISYSTSGPFAVSATTCTTTLDSKKSCTISVTFSPTKTGTATGTLTVKDSASDSPQKVSLSGTGD